LRDGMPAPAEGGHSYVLPQCGGARGTVSGAGVAKVRGDRPAAVVATNRAQPQASVARD
jgi:hypothetical protein